MKRRNFLVAIVFLLDACKQAIQSGTTPVVTPSTPSPDATGMVAPLPAASKDTVAQETPTPTPVPTPTMPIVLEAVHADVAMVADVAPLPQALAKDCYTFTLQALNGDTAIPDDLTIQVLSESASDLSVYHSDAQSPDLDLAWDLLATRFTQNADGKTATGRVKGAKLGRHLITGEETTNIPRSIEFSSTALIDPSVVESVDFPSESVAAFTTQSYLGHPFLSSISIPSDKISKGEKTVVILVHGARGEQDVAGQFGWRTFLTWLATGLSAAEFKRRFVVALYRDDTTLPVDVSADGLVAAIDSKYNGCSVILVGHSRGGLVCRAALAKKFASGQYRGIVTLGTPHRGTPLACPKLIRYGLSTQPFRTLLTVLHQTILTKVFGATRALTNKKRPADFVADFSKQFNEGLLSLAPHEHEWGIPTATFTTRYSFGPLTAFTEETIDPTDERVLRATSSSLYTQFAATIGVRTENGEKFVSQIELIEALEKKVGATARIVAYAGYCGGTAALRSANAFLDKAKTIEGFTAIVADSSIEMQQQMLKFLAGPINSMIPSATGRKSVFSDGLVRLEDALGLADGPNIETMSIDDLAQHSESIVQARKSALFKTIHVLRGYTHLDLLLKTGHFASVVANIIAFDDEIQASKTTTLSSADIAAIRALLQADFTGSNSSATASMTSSDSIIVAKGPNLASASLRVRIVEQTTSTSTTTYWQFYSAYFKKVGSLWYYQTSKQYDVNSRIATFNPPPLPQP